ncbi:UNVERIFIED_CONTAM: hypothetical protein HDU68_004053 [Siphonaria sp. JEL0065]|nr:hypothetical protein HDU68_004053 [Siphonaria sp. JEL0065]
MQHQHASVESNNELQKDSREAARVQWLRELDEQRRLSQLAKQKDNLERKQPVLVYSSLFEAPIARSLPAQQYNHQQHQQQQQSPQQTSFFTGGAPLAIAQTSVTGQRRRTLSEIKSASSTPSAPPPKQPSKPPAQPPSNYSNKKSNSNNSNNAYSSLADQLERANNQQQQQLNGSYGRIRSQFASDQSTDDAALKKKREAEAWREELRKQIEDKKKEKEASERNSKEFVYSSWGDNQYPGNHGGGGGGGGVGGSGIGSVTGQPMRRSARVIESGAGYDSQSGFEPSQTKESHQQQQPQNCHQQDNYQSQQPQQDRLAAPAAELPGVIHRSLHTPVISKIPRPNLPPRSVRPPPSPPLLFQPQQQESFGYEQKQYQQQQHYQNQQEPHRHQQSSSPTPSSLSSSPPPLQRKQNPSLSPTRKLTKILGSVKAGHGYPVTENGHGIQQGVNNKQQQQKKAAAAASSRKPRVKSAFGRTLPPESSPPSTKKTTTSSTSNLNPNKKLPAITRGGIVEISAKQRRPSTTSTSLQHQKQHQSIPDPTTVAVIQKSKFQQLQARIHQTVQQQKQEQQQQVSYHQQQEQIQSQHHQQYQQKQYETIEDKKRDRTVQRDPLRNNGGVDSVQHLVPIKQVLDASSSVQAAGTCTGRSLSRAEFTPQGTLRPPWGVIDEGAVVGGNNKERQAAGMVRIHGKLEKAGGEVARPPWGTEVDVPVRVLGRDRRPKGNRSEVEEQALRKEALNELTRFGSMLAEEKRVLRLSMDD